MRLLRWVRITPFPATIAFGVAQSGGGEIPVERSGFLKTFLQTPVFLGKPHVICVSFPPCSTDIASRRMRQQLGRMHIQMSIRTVRKPVSNQFQVLIFLRSPWKNYHIYGNISKKIRQLKIISNAREKSVDF